MAVTALEMKGFPPHLKFFPHGIYLLEKRLLYIINHAYDKGGERVEVFQVD
jgi:hypothetical protein